MPLLAWTMLLASALPVFEDVTARTSIGFRHNSSKTTRKYLIESVSGGVAMLDYDGDGRLDLYFVNGAALLDPMKAGAVPDKAAPQFWNRLYRNQGGGTFRDETETAGVRGRGYGMGAATGDYDNDGRTDLYVTNFGANILYRNKGDGTFEDVTSKAGVAAGGWSSSAAWVDYDHDGRLDLIVARYVQWDFEPDAWCGARVEGRRSYCHPDRFSPVTHIVYRNRGDGTFEDATRAAGWGAAAGKGLGIALADYDRDGRIDVAVANDSWPQQLFRNLGGGRFEETALNAGVAYDDDGRTYAGMGIDFADYDNDGWPDLFVNALAMQRYALYRNNRGLFEYASNSAGVAAITQLHSG
ncbi:MAG: FG-GAP repeat domain-containing protein, partial [Bryobacteraceae bacterium]